MQNVAVRLMRNRREKTAIAPMEGAVIPGAQGKSDGALDIDPTVEAAIKVCLWLLLSLCGRSRYSSLWAAR